MILIICPQCAFAARVIGDDDEVDQLVGEGSDFWPDHFPCPRCGARARGVAELDVSVVELDHLRLRDLNPQEALAAFSGLGLPDEQLCTKALLETLLREQPIRRVGAQDIEGSKRCYLHHLELWDGTKIYFGAGSGGAIVYRVTNPLSYTERVIDGLSG